MILKKKKSSVRRNGFHQRNVSPTPANSGEGLHPSLLGISAAMQKSKRERKQRLGLAQEFLQNIDAWAKAKVGTEDAPLLMPFIERIAPIVTAFAIGNAQISEPPCKSPFPRKNTATRAAPRVTKPAEGPNLALPERPKETKSQWVTIARKASKLPTPPAAPTVRKPALQKKPTEKVSPREDKRLF
ncbi:hypothetical protein K3495_g14246, partial [Podosphaera aphanis]